MVGWGASAVIRPAPLVGPRLTQPSVVAPLVGAVLLGCEPALVTPTGSFEHLVGIEFAPDAVPFLIELDPLEDGAALVLAL